MTSRSGRPTKVELDGLAADRVEVGRIVRAHGVSGEVAVDVGSDVPGRFAPGARLIAVPPAQAPRFLVISSLRPHKGGLLVRFEGVGDRTAAEALRGAALEVPRSEVPDAPEGMVYLFELVGARCVDRREGDLGTVEDVVEDGGGWLLRVRGARGELLVPYVEAIVPGVDLAAGRLELDLPEGFVEACGSV